MRITDNLISSSLEQNVQNSLSSLTTVTNEISTGKSLNSPSDNPAGTAEDLSLREALLGDTQYESDANQASNILNTSSSALSNVNTVLDQVNQIAIQGANTGAEGQTSLNSLADQVGTAIQQITQLANTNVAGTYVFGGTQTAKIGPNNSLTLNTPGSNGSLFTDTISTLQTLQSDLASGNSTAISSDITAVQNRITATSEANATIGGKINQVTSAQTTLQTLDTQYQSAQSGIENTDLATAYVQLQSAQNVYQASLVTVQDAYKYSLASMLS
jgi:flagellar hook-associated protein 3 FlgL